MTDNEKTDELKPVEFFFRKPLVIKGGKGEDDRIFKSIMIEDPTIAAMRAMEAAMKAGKSELEGMVIMLAHDSGIPAEAFDQVRAGDLGKMAKIMEPFIPRQSPAAGDTGEPSQPIAPAS